MDFPKILPTTAVVSTGISVRLSATVLPLSFPRDDRHFTKEEVKKATLARKLHVTSSSPPSITVGECVFFNPQQLTTASVGGNTQALIAIDDRSGYISVLGSKSKDKHDIMTCLEELIVTYNARNHHVTAFCSDSEAICHSLATPLGLFHAHTTRTL